MEGGTATPAIVPREWDDQNTTSPEHQINAENDPLASKEDFHPRVTVDQAEDLCHRITLHFGRLNIETGALYYCI